MKKIIHLAMFYICFQVSFMTVAEENEAVIAYAQNYPDIIHGFQLINDSENDPLDPFYALIKQQLPDIQRLKSEQAQEFTHERAHQITTCTDAIVQQAWETISDQGEKLFTEEICKFLNWAMFHTNANKNIPGANLYDLNEWHRVNPDMKCFPILSYVLTYQDILQQKKPNSCVYSLAQCIQNATNNNHMNIDTFVEMIHTANRQGEDKNLLTPLHNASDIGSIELAKLGLNLGANLELLDSDGYSPLYHASAWSNYEITELLINAGADINALITDTSQPHRGPVKNTALYKVIENMIYTENPESSDELRIVDLLINKKANLTLQDSNDRTPLQHAVHWYASKPIELLVKAGARINIKDRDGNTPLHLSLLDCDGMPARDHIKILLKGGAKPDMGNNDGDTALHLATYGDFQALQDLINDGHADVNLQNNNRQTPLHKAVLSPCNDAPLITKYLIDAGAWLDMKDNDGKTAFDLASPENYILDGTKEVLESVLMAQQDVNVAKRHDEHAAKRRKYT